MINHHSATRLLLKGKSRFVVRLNDARCSDLESDEPRCATAILLLFLLYIRRLTDPFEMRMIQ
jgi:hypothetical protein